MLFSHFSSFLLIRLMSNVVEVLPHDVGQIRARGLDCTTQVRSVVKEELSAAQIEKRHACWIPGMATCQGRPDVE